MKKMTHKKPTLLILLVLVFITSLISTGCTTNPGIETPVIPPQSVYGGQDAINYQNVVVGKIFTARHPFSLDEISYVYFGSYPKNEVTNATTIAALYGITQTNARGYLEYQGKEYAKVTIKNTYGQIGEVLYSDSGYTRLTGYTTGYTYFFEVLPILWQVLSYDEVTKEAFLLAANIVDASIYSSRTEAMTFEGQTVQPSNYEFSYVREFLNNEFYNKAFSSTEKSKVQVTHVKNGDINYLYDVTDRLVDTYDKVVIPSYREMLDGRYGFDGDVLDPSVEGAVVRFTLPSLKRVASSTDYSLAKGTIASAHAGQHSGIYLLRSSSLYSKTLCPYMTYDGVAHLVYYANSHSNGVRPAINVVLN